MIARGLKPEESDTYELGARYNDSVFNGVIGIYYVNFRNRLLGVQTGAGIVGNPAILQNVGSVRSIGFEAAGDLRLGGGLTLFASYSYTDASYRDDVVTPTAIIPTKGKDVVDTPKHLLRGEIAYDSDSFFGRRPVVEIVEVTFAHIVCADPAEEAVAIIGDFATKQMLRGIDHILALGRDYCGRRDHVVPI